MPSRSKSIWDTPVRDHINLGTWQEYINRNSGRVTPSIQTYEISETHMREAELRFMLSMMPKEHIFDRYRSAIEAAYLGMETPKARMIDEAVAFRLGKTTRYPLSTLDPNPGASAYYSFDTQPFNVEWLFPPNMPSNLNMDLPANKFLAELRTTRGDAGVAFARLCGNRWHNRLACEMETFRRSANYFCTGCDFNSQVQSRVRMHIAACPYWRFADEQASTMLFTDYNSLLVMFDGREELGLRTHDMPGARDRHNVFESSTLHHY